MRSDPYLIINPTKRRGRCLAGALAGALAGWLCLAPAAALTDSRLPVFVSILPQKYFVERIGGERVQVEVLVRPGQNPDTFDPTHRQMAGLAQSRLYFQIGVPFEAVWVPRIRRAYPHLKIVSPADPATSHPGRENPHRWLSPHQVLKMAEVIRDALGTTDPEADAVYRANFSRFAEDLHRLDREIRGILKPVHNRYFMVYHPAWLHFAESYGLKEIPIEMEGKEPGPQALAEVIQQGRDLKIKAVFVQKQFPHKVVEPIARALKARVIQVDPLAEDYLDNLRRVAIAFAEAMR